MAFLLMKAARVNFRNKCDEGSVGVKTPSDT